MHHLANSMTKLCHGREQDSAGWEGVPMYDCSGEEAVFIIVGRGWDLSICQMKGLHDHCTAAVRCGT